MDAVVGLVVRNWIFGALFGVGCAIVLLALDVAGLRDQIFRPAGIEWIALATLVVSFALTFAGIIAASAIMLVPRPPEG